MDARINQTKIKDRVKTFITTAIVVIEGIIHFAI